MWSYEILMQKQDTLFICFNVHGILFKVVVIQRIYKRQDCKRMRESCVMFLFPFPCLEQVRHFKTRQMYINIFRFCKLDCHSMRGLCGITTPAF